MSKLFNTEVGFIVDGKRKSLSRKYKHYAKSPQSSTVRTWPIVLYCTYHHEVTIILFGASFFLKYDLCAVGKSGNSSDDISCINRLIL